MGSLKKLIGHSRSVFSNVRKFRQIAFAKVANGIRLFASAIKRFFLWLTLSVKTIALKTVLFFTKNFTIILYSILSLIFIALLILLVFYDRMGEVDTALKYVLLPVYIFSALFSGRIVTKKIKHRIMIFLRREPESRWATKAEMTSNANIKKSTLSVPHTKPQAYLLLSIRIIFFLMIARHIR